MSSLPVSVHLLLDLLGAPRSQPHAAQACCSLLGLQTRLKLTRGMRHDHRFATAKSYSQDF